MDAQQIRPLELPSEGAGETRALDLERYLPFLIVATGNRISSSASQCYLDRFGIGVTAWRVLANLKVEPGQTANAIAAASDLDKGAVSRAVAGLIGDRYLHCAEDISDRRRRPLYLTETGAELHDRVLTTALDRERHLLHGLNPEEVGALLRMLAIVHRNARTLE